MLLVIEREAGGVGAKRSLLGRGAGRMLSAATALGDARRRRPFTRAWLGATAAMGGWRNWRQNMVDGWPIPAPPSFVALALAGLAALGLMRAHPDD